MALTTGPKNGGLDGGAKGEYHFDELLRTWRLLDLLVQPQISSFLAAPPGSPAEGQAHAVVATATGAWAGQEGRIARYTSRKPVAGWELIVPKPGFVVWDIGTGRYWRYNNSVWSPMSKREAINAYIASATMVQADVESTVQITSASGVTYTIPPNATVAVPINAEIEVIQGGAGAITLTPGSGVTINKRSAVSLVTNGQWAVAKLRKIDTNVWVASGNLA